MIRKRLRRLGVGADIGLTVTLQVMAAVVSYAFQVMVFRSLTAEESGIYFLAISYITIASGLADFGLIATITPRLAVAGGEATPAFKAGLVLRAVMLVAGWLLLNAYLAIARKWDLMPLVNVASLAVVIGAKTTGVRQFFDLLWRLRGRTYVLTAVGVFDMVVGLAALVLLALFGEPTPMKVMLIFTLCNLPGFVIVSFPFVRRLRANGFFQQKIPFGYYRAVFLMSLPVGLMVILGQTSGQLETLVLEGFMSHADIAAYTAGSRPLIGLSFVATTVGFGLAPLVAQHVKRTRTDASFEFIISVGLRLIGVVALAMCAVCGLFAEQIMRIAGPQYVDEAYILRVFSAINALSFLVIMLDQFLLAMGKRRESLYGALIYFAAALGLEVVIIRDWGISGMLYAKMVAICCLLAFQIAMVGQEVRRAALKAIGNLIPSAAVLLAALVFTGGLDLPIRVAVVTAAVLATMLLMRTIRVSELRMLRTMRVT